MSTKNRRRNSNRKLIDPFALNAELEEMFLDAASTVQVIGTPEQFASGALPTLRKMTLDDIEDDCPACQECRAQILAGNAPMVYAFD